MYYFLNKKIKIFSLDGSYLSYGLAPQICAALFTSHVECSEIVYRSILPTYQLLAKVSPVRYHGKNVGMPKLSNGINNT